MRKLNPQLELEVIYRDDDLIAITKPSGLLVHRTKLAYGETQFALQLLRDQIGQRVYPCHRLDRKTSGVLLFALNEEKLKEIRALFEDHKVRKKYQALVRGHTAELFDIDYALTNDRGIVQEAFTSVKTLERFEIPLPFGKHQTSRYSLVELSPTTGRYHQLRKHMAHVFHPIIGDRPHGCNKQNRLWKETWGDMKMYLHASNLSIPCHGELLDINSSFDAQFTHTLKRLEKKQI